MKRKDFLKSLIGLVILPFMPKAKKNLLPQKKAVKSGDIYCHLRIDTEEFTKQLKALSKHLDEIEADRLIDSTSIGQRNG